jgi:predicted RNA-binding protein with TRAM domain
MMGELEEGATYDVDIKAKNMRGEGIGRIKDTVVFVKNAKTRIGKAYKIRVTKVHRTFADAEILDENSKYFIGNGALIIQ